MEDLKFAVLFAATILAARQTIRTGSSRNHAALPGAGDHHHRRDQQSGGDHEEDREELSCEIDRTVKFSSQECA